ncbi:SpoIIE family protein phosphatase [Streptomyces sp. MS06]|uniref:SpoIIE family protein phosphatase n=1 Tax=Streptomyces sp. MS06 TaxID=3385974 RepID=UPI0039A2E0CA
MTSDRGRPADWDTVPDLAALTGVVARQRAELDRMGEAMATSAVLERAKGALMALTGCSPDAAYEELLRRAKSRERTLLEECWVTLGGLPPHPGPSGTEPSESADPGPAPSAPPGAVAVHDAAALARLGQSLIHVHTLPGLATALLEQLARTADADAVMLYARLPTGGLELVGHAGVDDRLAAQWRQVPPLSTVAALHALQTQEPCWIEDLDEAGRRYLLMGESPERWPCRAWLPVTTGGRAEVALGVLRARDEPFSPRTREHLRSVVRLCAGRLRVLEAPHDRGTDTATEVVQELFDALPGAALLLAPLRAPGGEIEDFRIDAAAPQTVDATGRAGRDLVGVRLLDYRPTVTAEPLWRGCLHTLATGQPYAGEPFAQQETSATGAGGLTTYSARVARFGERLVVTWLRHDPSDRQEQRLSEVQRLGRLGWATWNLLTQEASWSAEACEILGRDPARGPVGLTELAALAVPEDMPLLATAVGRLLRDGHAFDLPFRLPTAKGVRHLRLVAEAVADDHGTPVEVHGFLQDLTAQRSAELALVESERAVLTQHGALQAERTVAARLQHALLPLPAGSRSLAGLRVDVAYLPAQSGLNVGGDWFSAIELPGGDALFVVGDVAGHGIDAVAVMAQLRFTAKGMVSTGSSLTGALARLNSLLRHAPGPHGNATMVMARYRAAGRRLAWAQAGHPPPVLVRGGSARLLTRPRGVLLGATDEPVFEESQLDLAPGDRLVLYTDGLVERPGESIDQGFARLVDALSSRGPGTAGASAARLAAALESEQRDDVCVLDIRVPVEPGPGR